MEQNRQIHYTEREKQDPGDKATAEVLLSRSVLILDKDFQMTSLKCEG